MNELLRSRTRVLVTGLGAVTPAGTNVPDFWESMLAGRSGIDHITFFDTTQFPCKFAGEIPEFVPADFMDRKAARRMGRFSQLMVAAAREAIHDASLDLEAQNLERTGVLVGNGGGGYPGIQEAAHTLFKRGGMRIDPLFFSKQLANMAGAQVAMQFGLRGYNGTVVTACAAGTQAIGEAALMIRTGRADVVLAGGCEAGISELGLAGFCVMKAVTSSEGDPTRASRPFDAARDGFVPCEGAGALLLESEEHALRRGARAYAEVAGFGCTSDAFHVVAPPEGGEGAARAMQEALDDAGMGPGEIGYINAHATSTPAGDAAETSAIKTVFGERAYDIPISATKSLIGHGLGASGGMETVAAIKTLETGLAHPTINLETPDPTCDLDYIPEGQRRVDPQVIMKNSFGFGGQNSCLVLSRYEA